MSNMKSSICTFAQKHFHFSVLAFLLLLTQNSHCADPIYNACAPIDYCSHPIRYPFYTLNQNPSFGFPGFMLTCSSDGLLFLQFNRTYYVVDEILYDNTLVRVYNPAVLTATCGCLPRNIVTLNLAGDSRFRFVNSSELVMLANCSTNVRSEFLRYRAGCGWDLAVLGGDEAAVRNATKGCAVRVAAPVQARGGERVGEYRELMRRGFLLNWTVTDCRSKYLRENSFWVGKKACHWICLYCSWSFDHGIPWKNICHENEVQEYGSLAPKNCSYKEIKKMTNSFKDKLGQGGYGTVYKGELSNGNLVAVKLLKETKGEGEEIFNEIASISRTLHVNGLTLLGYCIDGKKRALIYEFMRNGSLDKFLYDGISSTNHQLGWEIYYKIATGIARGLEYLHRGCNTRILHLDIKPHNILLDEDFTPKISDFGLAKLCPGKESAVSIMNARGTIGYIAPEVFSRNFGRVSHKSDVYSYGMMVLEMVGGRKNLKVEVGDTMYFPDWIYEKIESDHNLELYGIMDEDENVYARKMIIVSLWCIQSSPSTRPSMSSVVEMLEGKLESLEIPPKPFLSSPPSSPPTHYSSTIQISESQLMLI